MKIGIDLDGVVIDKKYLSEELLRLLEQEPIEFEIEDPF